MMRQVERKQKNLSEISYVCWLHTGAHRLPTPLRETQRRFLPLGEKLNSVPKTSTIKINNIEAS